jgi:hypothetical protein
MTPEEKRIQERLKKAWAALPPDEKSAHRSLIEDAHEYLFAPVELGLAESNDTAPHEMVMVKYYLDDNLEGHNERMMLVNKRAIETGVTEGGNIWGTGKYQTMDIRWVEAFAVYLEYLVIGKINFPAGTPNVIAIPDSTKIIMAGDWGTGNWGTENAPSIKMIEAITSQSPDYTIHLGDVYYAGTKNEETDNLVNIWPKGTKGTFAINSNHEMYSGAHSYFSEALGKLFLDQQGHSYFALENTHWIIVGLDSAYFDTSKLYRAGSIGKEPQIQFLKDQAAKGKKIIVLTHHNGLIDQKDGTQQKNHPLWNQVMEVFPDVQGPAYWYWGHIHSGTVYQTNAFNNQVCCRCLGHGGIPSGFSEVLLSAKANGSVIWFEGKDAQDPNNKFRVMNGFVTLELNGEKITETYYNENGNSSWTS